jgi:hypothetical protein
MARCPYGSHRLLIADELTCKRCGGDVRLHTAVRDLPVAFYNEARRLWDDGEIQGAEVWLQAALKLKPNSPETLWLLGMVEAGMGRTDRSIAHLMQARELGANVKLDLIAAEMIQRDPQADALQPIIKCIQMLCRLAESEARRNPPTVTTVVRRLVEQAEPLLAALNSGLPQGHRVPVEAADEVALSMVNCDGVLSAGARGMRACQELCKKALQIAGSEAARSRIKALLEEAKWKREQSTCWFCLKRLPVESAAIEVKLFRKPWMLNGRGPQSEAAGLNRREAGEEMTVRVPRCKTCDSFHNWMGGLNSTPVVMSVPFILVILAGLRMAGVPGLFAGVVCGLLIIGMAEAMAGKFLPYRVRDEASKWSFPTVKQRMANGWDIE